MTEKVTGLDYHDFINMNVAITSLIKEYQAIIDAGSPSPDRWGKWIVSLKETQAKLKANRSFE